MSSRPPGDLRDARWERALHVALLIAVPLLVFANTLGNGYHLDDFAGAPVLASTSSRGGFDLAQGCRQPACPQAVAPGTHAQPRT